LRTHTRSISWALESGEAVSSCISSTVGDAKHELAFVGVVSTATAATLSKRGDHRRAVDADRRSHIGRGGGSWIAGAVWGEQAQRVVDRRRRLGEQAQREWQTPLGQSPAFARLRVRVGAALLGPLVGLRVESLRLYFPQPVAFLLHDPEADLALNVLLVSPHAVALSLSIGIR
jgi:hypothetical protein